jgi:hypothetical protein
MNRAISVAALGLLVVVAAAYFVGGNRRTVDDAGGQVDPATLSALEARLAEMESAVQSMADHQGILENELQYTRGLDRHDETLITDSFWPDALASYGTLVDIEGLAVWANEGHSNSAAHQHHVTTLSLDIDGDTAHEEGYILYSSDMPRNKTLDAEGAPTPGRAVPGTLTTLGTGRYVNRYERRNGDWRMIVHEYVHDVSMLLETVDLCATNCLGTWDSSDISYLRPLRPLSVEERRERAERGMTPRAATPSQRADDQGDRE